MIHVKAERVAAATLSFRLLEAMMVIRNLNEYKKSGIDVRFQLDIAYRRVLQSLRMKSDPDGPLCAHIARKIILVRERGVTNIAAIAKIARRELERDGKR